ncbi:beta-ketoacyl-ACP synthase I [Brevundimonas sp. 3P9-tot-E]|uniref:beta-ketoacyl-ACP synthase I n=1 Tax=Brevundimonas TaxID=41275 RepID=UPI001904D61E|nr:MULTISPECIES: beta-ketoacyl-ACP synthase I [Brevundimonas]MBK1970250.1 beta-ketoacyl-ACP synthase I [Brevundimonas diminuta]MBK1975907.1 beta-ketoacyl-ACP synthase I [Brevundimonas diminuta]MDA1321199.1 beta-ketoacyl-ACP synthase I [Pseudomonadota bacterium]MDM8352366.1 beta-ketoacyl-ACP synthase I [Brevundimonas diminuta]
MRRVVVTGLGIVSSIGTGQDQVAASLRDAKSGVQHAADHAKYGFRSQVWAPPALGHTAEDWAPLVDRRAARFLANGTAWAHIAFEEALKDSGLSADEIKNERIGLIVGEGGPSTQVILQAAATTVEKGSPKRVGPFAVPKAMASGPSAVLATWFELKGVNYSISSACATSAHCIGAAAEQIAWGKQDVVFAGGCEDIDWSMSNMFDAMGAMSSNFNDTPDKASRAYDTTRDGFVIAGGAGIVVLEEYERAVARGATIYAEVTGYGANSDGYDMVAPSGEGAERCMKIALEMAGNPKIDYLNPHGTSTPVGDLKEMGAVRNVFGDAMPMISSTKSLTGHSLGAAGAQEAIYCLLMMKHGFAAESAHIETLDPEFEGMPILRQRHDGELTHVMSNSFGFGGTNATLILSKV